jgi:hypothetical protein
MEHASAGPQADFVGERACDFAEALAALHELVGCVVTVSVLGGLRESRHAPLVLRGDLCCGYELGRAEDSPVCFELAGVLLFVSPDNLAGAWREEYRRRCDGRHWLVVTLQYRGGARIEIEQLI